MTTFTQLPRRAWAAIRALFGDDAYERYLEHAHRAHPDAAPLTRADFHRTELDRRWSQVNRCC